MASSNRHWPSMFKSKPCNPHHHQWQPDHNITPLISNPTSHKSPFSSSERSADPKPRWNPKREQIQILEAIFNSGMVNPPRDEIRRIRAELEEYGHVGDANVFYWFQNRKSRTKHKLRQLNQTTTNKSQPPHINLSNTTTTTAPPPSSSSFSSDKSSQKSSNNKKADTSFPMVSGINHWLNSHSPSAPVNQPYFRTTHASEFLPEPYFFQMPPVTGGITTLSNGSSDHGPAFAQGFCFPPADHELVSSTNAVVVHDNGCHDDDHAAGNGSNVLLTDLMMNFGPLSYKKLDEDHDKVKMMQPQQLTHVTSASAAHTLLPPPPPPTAIITSTVNQLQGFGEGKSTVFINDVAFEVAVGPFNVREAFGDDAVLINSWGQPVETNEWGVTLQSLQHGALYYLVRTLLDPIPVDLILNTHG